MPSPSSPASPQLFQCPTCGAALPVPDDDPSLRCEYCGRYVLVPPEYRQRSQPETSEARPPVVIQISNATEPQTIDLSEAAARSARPVAGITIALVIGCLVIGVIGAVLAAAGVFTTAALVNESVSEVITQAPNLPAVPTDLAQLLLTAIPSPNPDYGFALQFGAAGTGPGQLDDARYLAVDPSGNIYTAEYQDGRLQSFDPEGKFKQLINVAPDEADYITISDLASDYNGRLLVARRGDILIYNAADGALADTISGEFPNTWYGALAIDPANTIYALHTSAGELDLIKINPNGQVTWRKPQITAGLVKNTEISTVRRLAVDGLGNIYLLDDSQNQVYQYDADGNFVDRFGSEGDGPGLLASPEDLTVDGQGRIYILDQDGIEIFDNNGAPIKLIPGDYEGYAFDIKLDLAGNAYVITNAPQVYKLRLNLGE